MRACCPERSSTARMRNPNEEPVWPRLLSATVQSRAGDSVVQHRGQQSTGRDILLENQSHALCMYDRRADLHTRLHSNQRRDLVRSRKPGNSPCRALTQACLRVRRQHVTFRRRAQHPFSALLVSGLRLALDSPKCLTRAKLDSECHAEFGVWQGPLRVRFGRAAMPSRTSGSGAKPDVDTRVFPNQPIGVPLAAAALRPTSPGRAASPTRFWALRPEPRRRPATPLFNG